MSDLATGYELMMSGRAAVWVPRDFVRVKGPDAQSYLQGQLSQDIVALEQGASAWSFILQPQGKVSAWFRITRLGSEEFVLDLDPGWAETLIERLNRFKLRVDATIEGLDWKMLALRFSGDSPATDGLAAVVDGGIDVLGENVEIPAGFTEVSPNVFELRRIELGTPRMGAELDEDTIPAASGVVDRSASFTKGCYTGQELVARVDSRGNNTPTNLRLLRSTGVISIGDSIGDDQGTVTSAAVHPDGGFVALGYVKRAVDVPTQLRVGDAVAAIEALP